jgi:hypothetical protein
MNRIKVEISTFPSNKWIYIPKSIKPSDDDCDDYDRILQRDIERDPFPIYLVRRRALCRSFFGCCSAPVEMDQQIIENGLKVLACKKSKTYGDETAEILKQQQGLKEEIDKIGQKLNLILNKKIGSN